MAKKVSKSRFVKRQSRVRKGESGKPIVTKNSGDDSHEPIRIHHRYGKVENPLGTEAKATGAVVSEPFGFTDAAEENKNQRLELRLTKVQKEVITKASTVSGFKNISDYILHIAIADSKNVIREQQLFELSERDRLSFMETIENASQPGKNLKKAMASYLAFQKQGK